MVGLSFESGFRLFVVETLIECIAGIKFRVCATGSLNGLVGEDTKAFRQLAAFNWHGGKPKPIDGSSLEFSYFAHDVTGSMDRGHSALEFSCVYPLRIEVGDDLNDARDHFWS